MSKKGSIVKCLMQHEYESACASDKQLASAHLISECDEQLHKLQGELEKVSSERDKLREQLTEAHLGALKHEQLPKLSSSLEIRQVMSPLSQSKLISNVVNRQRRKTMMMMETQIMAGPDPRFLRGGG